MIGCQRCILATFTVATSIVLFPLTDALVPLSFSPLNVNVYHRLINHPLSTPSFHFTLSASSFTSTSTNNGRLYATTRRNNNNDQVMGPYKTTTNGRRISNQTRPRDVTIRPSKNSSDKNASSSLSNAPAIKSSTSNSSPASSSPAKTTASSSPSKKTASSSSPPTPTFRERAMATSATSAGAVALAAVNAAVALQSLEAPDLAKSYIARDMTTGSSDAAAAAAADVEVDEEGLPLVYDKDKIQAYWKAERFALNKRWSEFIGKAIPFLTKLVTLYIRDGAIRNEEMPALARQARLDIQALGPTFIKAGQMMSVRPDVLPPVALEELALLQDSVQPFDHATALTMMEKELGGPLEVFFADMSEHPIAAASLAQVYQATLWNGTRVAVKIQRPSVLGTVSKDLYVLRRAVEVWQGLVSRFAPQQRTDYVALLNEWAIGFYTELDFKNEAKNQKRLRQILLNYNITGVVVPRVYEELCTRRILVSEWMDGTKLSQCTAEQIAEVTAQAQEAFLTQLFEAGFFHADPHPGNLLYLDAPTKDGAKLALIDCGLMANIDPKDQDYMISAVIHLANKDYPALVDDFMNLGILPTNTNRATVIPLMDKALSPYVKGGGTKTYEAELLKSYGMDSSSNMQSQVGGFQAMTQDALTVLNDVPFSIPPYFALLGRAIVTLEGVALCGDPDYAIIRSSYPFVARKLVREGRPEIQKALQEVLFNSNTKEKGSKGFKLTRLVALLNNAAGMSVNTGAGSASVDLDAIPEEGALSLAQGLKYVLSNNAGGLRKLLEPEVDNIVDVISRQVFRRAVSKALIAMTPPKPPAIPFLGDIFPQPPAFDEVPFPILLPGPDSDGDADGGGRNRPSLGLTTMKELSDTLAPRLNQEEDVFLIGLAEAANEFLGKDFGDLIKGERVLDPNTIQLVLPALRSGLLGRSDLMSSAVTKSVINFIGNTLSVLRLESQKNFAGQDLLVAAMAALDATERKRLDDIVDELIRRVIQRAVMRLSSMPRVA